MLWRATKAFTAGIVILALLAGIPVVLAWLGHDPLPALAQFWADPTARDDGSLFLAMFTLVGWAAWASFALAILTEVPALFGRSTRRLPGLSTQQWLARTLLSAVATAIITPTIASATAAALGHHDLPVHVASVWVVDHETIDATTDTGGGKQTVSLASAHHVAGITHAVQRGEVLLDLAERYFQDRDAVKAIAEANYGILQSDGRTLERGHIRIYAGWQLRIPTYNGMHPATPATVDTSSNGTSTTARGGDLAQDSVIGVASDPPQQRTYQICRGDTLWEIAATHLGDPEAWQDIWALNKGKTFNDGRTFIRPGLIHAGWILDLPAGHTVTHEPSASSPAARTEPPQSFLDRHAHDGDEAPVPPTQPADLPGDDGVSMPSTAPNSGQQAQQTPATSGQTSQVTTEQGILLPGGSWIGLGLAAAIALVGRLVWLQRRRRYRPQPPSSDLRLADSDTAPLPPVVGHIQRRLDTLPQPPTAIARERAPAALTPPALRWDEEHQILSSVDTARAVLVQALAAGGRDLDQRGHVVIPAATLVALLPDHDVRTLPATPRLIITNGLADALDWCEEQLLFRRRILISHEVDTTDELRGSDPLAEPMPPITLIAHAPGVEDRARASAILSQGASVNMAATLLGPDNGVTPRNRSQPPTTVGSLTADDAAILLRTVTESHTGFAPQPGQSPDDVDAADEAHGQADPTDADSVLDNTSGPFHDLEIAERGGARNREAEELFASDAADATGDHEVVAVTRVRITVLGDVVIHNPDNREIDPIRRPSKELAAYLIANGGQARQTSVLEDLLPDAPARRAQGRLDTSVYSLRLGLKQIGGSQLYLDHPRHRYVLNPDALDVDLWHLRDALTRAQQARNRDDRVAALREAISYYTGPFAGDLPYEWKDRYVYAISRQVLDARIALAEALEHDDPHAALDVLRGAISQEPQAEEPYKRAMDLHARLGDADAIRDLRRTITRVLEEDGINVSDDLLAHAEDLIMRAAKKRPARSR